MRDFPHQNGTGRNRLRCDFFGPTISGEKNVREITVVILDNGNGDNFLDTNRSEAHGGIRTSALTKDVVRHHMESHRSIAKSIQASKLSQIENTTLRSLPGLAVNPVSTRKILKIDDLSIVDNDDSLADLIHLNPNETSRIS